MACGLSCRTWGPSRSFGNGEQFALTGGEAVRGEPPAVVVVVGGGRVGRAFLQMAGARSRTVLVRRGERVTEGEGPVIVATHCSQLDSVLQQTPTSRWSDLVFLQNGMLQPWLAHHDLQLNTQAVLYMAATDADPCLPHEPVKITDGGRESLIWGRWASAMADMMNAEGISCSVVSSHDLFLDGVVTKLLWSSIFWLLSTALGVLPVDIIARDHRKDVHDLVSELLPLATKKSGQNELSVGKAVEELCSYSMSIESAVPSVEMAASEFTWRNGWFLKQHVSPCHLFWLQSACRQSSSANLKAILSKV